MTVGLEAIGKVEGKLMLTETALVFGSAEEMMRWARVVCMAGGLHSLQIHVLDLNLTPYSLIILQG